MLRLLGFSDFFGSKPGAQGDIPGSAQSRDNTRAGVGGGPAGEIGVVEQVVDVCCQGYFIGKVIFR